ncbi:hypothetical protein [Pseudomonas multiresinivorans]|uniref:Uncharacterized protein n=1 Tax=Pseudomonas multiresinivorans TaxID=95301 RepID=A0A7Z3GN05_9PSED|nr:hypothetical protein [Pseudomonas multiresinivorans]QJP06318.1 hypothetical protein G4G71_10890 [Pseudomonas multiresinivorans]QJP06324.1 hypothetical protein G4G71_22390 [Pseudomonas multiresinivorans]
MNREHELSAELDNYIAGLRIENINLKLAAKKAQELISDAVDWIPVGTVMRSNVEAFLASQQGEQCQQCSGSGTVSDSDGCGVWYIGCPSCPPEHPEQAEGAQGELAVLAWLESKLNDMPAWFGGEDHTRTSGWMRDQFILLIQEARAALAQPSPACSTCNDTGMVDDGEITHSEGGIPYENGPVKCVKDCPTCKAQPSPAPELVNALRQYQHNDCSGVVFGYDKAETERIVAALRVENSNLQVRLTGMTFDRNCRREERDAAQARVAELEKLSRAHDPLRIGLSAMLGSFKVAANAEQEGTLRMAQQLFDATADARYGDFKNKAVVDRLIAGLASPVSQAGQVPEGWKLVPTKPTIEMVEAGYEESFGKPDRSEHARVIEQYDAMLAAAPAQGGADPEEDWHRDMQLNDDRDRADYLDSLEDGGDE